ncbi:MAG: hypothetical protein ACYDA9_04230 [Terriglobia bacterium]
MIPPNLLLPIPSGGNPEPWYAHAAYLRRGISGRPHAHTMIAAGGRSNCFHMVVVPQRWQGRETKPPFIKASLSMYSTVLYAVCSQTVHSIMLSGCVLY